MHAPSTENLVVNAFGPYLAAMHLQDLLDEAALARRARLARGRGADVPAWRRGLGGAFASAARSLDPSIDRRHMEPRSAKGTGARATA